MIEKCVYEGPIAGVNFKKDAWKLWLYTRPKVGDPLYFYHETKNKYDSMAIAIKYAQRQTAPKIGYVPKAWTHAFHAAHHLGMRLRGEVVILNGPHSIIRAYAVPPIPVVSDEEET
jgi:hypothetical protein